MFVEQYLQDLRRDRFRPRAVAIYLRRIARRVRQDFDASPAAVRSVWSVALGFFAVAFVAAAATALTVDRHLAQNLFLATALWIIPVFTLVTLHIGLLRDREGFRLSALNVPTVLTLARLLLAPAIALLLTERLLGAALTVYLIAAMTDVADGWLARRTGQITRLGVMIDPIVDIVFNLTIFAGLAVAGFVPMWVFAIAAVRYGMMLGGGACLYLFVGPVRIQPTLFGRLTGVVMTALVALLTLLHTVRGAALDRLVPLTEIALGALLTATVAHVVILGWFNLRLLTGRAAAPGRVVGDVRWGA